MCEKFVTAVINTIDDNGYMCIELNIYEIYEKTTKFNKRTQNLGTVETHSYSHFYICMMHMMYQKISQQRILCV